MKILQWLTSQLPIAGLLPLFFLLSFPSSYGREMAVEEALSVDLPFGDINVVVLTDVHSWVGGHDSVSQSVDYGNVLSFYQLLKAHCSRNHMDLWFVVNGDWIDGTGISLNSDTTSLTQILQKMPWDALNVGNHELYRDKVVTDALRPGGFVEWWGDRYISSNVVETNGQQPLGERYRFFRGSNSTVLTFGFLYNMDDASSLVTVEKVEAVVEAEWFVNVVTNSNNDPEGEYDAILVMAHMDVKDGLVTVLLDKIRDLVGETMPIQFITGHTHFRRFATLDSASVSFEAGKFLDTIGFVSFPKKQTLLLKASSDRRLQDEEAEGEETPPMLGPQGMEWQNVSDLNAGNSTQNPPTARPTVASTLLTNQQTEASLPPAPPPALSSANGTQTTPGPAPTNAPTQTATKLFHHKFIDTNIPTLQDILGVAELKTEDGAQLSEFILRTRRELGLLEKVGCAPTSYYLNRTVKEEDSLWRLFLETVAPYQLLKSPSKVVGNQTQPQRMFIANPFSFRYDLMEGSLIWDDVIAVAPFNDTLISLGPNIPGSVVIQMITNVLNKEPNPFNPKWQNVYFSPSLENLKPDILYEILTPSFGVKTILNGLSEVKYNGTVQQEDIGFTDLAVWRQFVQDKWECKNEEPLPTNQGGASSHGNSNQNNNDNHHNGGSLPGQGTGTHSGTPYYEGNSGQDKFRLVLASIGVCCVLFLGSIYIWQLHKSWLIRYRERQRLIFIVDSENDNELI